MINVLSFISKVIWTLVVFYINVSLLGVLSKQKERERERGKDGIQVEPILVVIFVNIILALLTCSVIGVI